MNATIYTPKGKIVEPKDVYELRETYNATGYKDNTSTAELCELEEGTIVWIGGMGIFLVKNSKLRKVCR